jgi:tRNA modification GTPase
MTEDDTIAAISTALGEGGIGIVRLSGKSAVAIAEKLFSSPRSIILSSAESHKLLHGFIKDPATGDMVDEVLLAVMRAPHTYTREDVVEINCHGGMLPLRRVLELALRLGARLGEPGEFTKRAFLNGRLDLTQAEAVIDLVRAQTEASSRLAMEQLSGGLAEKITLLRDGITSLCVEVEASIDFPEEGIEPVSRTALLAEMEKISDEIRGLSQTFEEGRFFREGVKVAIVGRPNVGKSSLLNALLMRDRAIVTETPGTTRDVLEEHLNLKGLPVRVMDTAGIRETHEMVEAEGVRRSMLAIADADVVMAVFDSSRPLTAQDREVIDHIGTKPRILVLNKLDLAEADNETERVFQGTENVIARVSAKTGAGLGELKDRLVDLVLAGSVNAIAPGEITGIIVTNVRHKSALDGGAQALDNARQALDQDQPSEIIAIELREALDRLGEIVGAVTTEEILNRIFSEFCIGK